MVTSVTNLGRSGLFDWLVQRFSAVILGAYMLCAGTSLQPQEGQHFSGLFRTVRLIERQNMGKDQRIRQSMRQVQTGAKRVGQRMTCGRIYGA